MEEADKLCDRIAIVDHGKLVALGTPVELKTASPAPMWSRCILTARPRSGRRGLKT